RVGQPVTPDVVALLGEGTRGDRPLVLDARTAQAERRTRVAQVREPPPAGDGPLQSAIVVGGEPPPEAATLAGLASAQPLERSLGRAERIDPLPAGTDPVLDVHADQGTGRGAEGVGQGLPPEVLLGTRELVRLGRCGLGGRPVAVARVEGTA